MAALPGLTTTSLTKEWTKALVSVSSLVLRKSLISSAKVAMVSALSSSCRRSFSNAPCLLCGDLKGLLALPVLPDAVRGVGHLGVGGLDEVPDAAQPLLHVLKLPLDGLQPLTLLVGHPVCQGRCENVPAGRSKTVRLNAVEWASRFVGRWRSGSVR